MLYWLRLLVDVLLLQRSLTAVLQVRFLGFYYQNHKCRKSSIRSLKCRMQKTYHLIHNRSYDMVHLSVLGVIAFNKEGRFYERGIGLREELKG